MLFIDKKRIADSGSKESLRALQAREISGCYSIESIKLAYGHGENVYKETFDKAFHGGYDAGYKAGLKDGISANVEVQIDKDMIGTGNNSVENNRGLWEEQLKRKDKNGVEWVEGKHKYSLFDGGAKAETHVVEVSGKEVLIRFFDDDDDDYFPAIYTQKRAAQHLTFVEPQETVDDIRADVAEQFLGDYVYRYGIRKEEDFSISYFPEAVNHIIDRVVKSMEAEHE